MKNLEELNSSRGEESLSKSEPLIFTMYNLDFDCFLRFKTWTGEDPIPFQLINVQYCKF